ncbi:MAG: hypothetical protein ACRD3E_13455 [Terriglobales bacterium]
MRNLRQVTENVVIWEFLRNEFHHHDFDGDRERYLRFVENPDLKDARENAVRRALFYRRRGHMWNQLPPDTVWHEVQLEPRDLDRLDVFARTHWRKIGGHSCRLAHVVKRMRDGDFSKTYVVGGTANGGVEISRVGDVVTAVKEFSHELAKRTDCSAAVLIGVDDASPVTILEGNHRFAAALLHSPDLLFRQFRVFYGASPSMTKCCWYGPPTAPNMARYAFKRLKHFGNREADIERLLPLLYPELQSPKTGFSGPYSADRVG